MSPGDEMAAVLVLLSALRTFWMLIIAVFLALWGIHHSDICPAVVRDGVRYGKLVPSAGAAGLIRHLQVPKRWFSHFYIAGFAWHAAVLVVLFDAVGTCKGWWSGLGVLPALVALAGDAPPRPSESAEASARCHGASATPVLLAAVLYLLQLGRRLFESTRLAVHSRTATMHVAHYAFGIAYYAVVPLSIAVSSPALLAAALSPTAAYGGGGQQHRFSFAAVWWGWRWQHMLGTGLFLWGSLHQWRCHGILARLRHPALRKAPQPEVEHARAQHREHDRRGGSSGDEGADTITIRGATYCVPRGDWFELVSCPHFLAEIIIYTGLALVLHGGDTYSYVHDAAYADTGTGSIMWLVALTAFLNLAFTAMQTHHWYRQQFGDRYPAQRRAIVPFLL